VNQVPAILLRPDHLALLGLVAGRDHEGIAAEVVRRGRLEALSRSYLRNRVSTRTELY